LQVWDWARRLPAAVGVSLALGLVTATAGQSLGPHARLAPAAGVLGEVQLTALQERAAPADPGAAAGAATASAADAQRAAAGSRAASQMTASSVRVAGPNAHGARLAVAPLRTLRQADLLVVAPGRLPGGLAARIRQLHGVVAAQSLDAARIQVNGTYIAMLGVDPSSFRAFAAPPTARSSALWRNVADGGIAVSYTMGKQDKIPLGRTVRVNGVRPARLRVGGFGTIGIAGVDAVVSKPVARSLGLPAGNAIVISAPHDRLAALVRRVQKLLPRRASVAPLVAQQAAAGTPATSGAAGTSTLGTGAAGTGASGAAGVASAGPGLSPAEIARFLTAAESRIGMPYVWGAAGPRAFDCSGLVQWSLAQAGVVMPRVAADQALTGPQVPVSDLRPGDLLFYHTDPTAPTYISHVAIYIGDGKMLQAPEPGMDVEVVPADVGNEFAGAVRIYPRVAAEVAASPVG
jgi:cell wall-associated NlpC family hydrolase